MATKRSQSTNDRRHFPVSLWNESRRNERQTLEQVWFPGFHSDVGGSHPDPRVSDITLKWMLENARDKGLRLRDDWAESLAPDPLGAIQESRKGLWLLWPPAERRIPESSKIHASVFRRMENSASPYHPRNLPAKYHVVD